MIAERPRLSAQTLKLLRAIAAIGAAVVIAGAFLNPARTWPSLLLASYYLASLGLSGLFFVAVQYLGKARWSTAFRRVPEAMTSVLPITGALMLLTVLGAKRLYEWTHAEGDPLIEAKSAWLNLPFFVVRILIYFAVWIVFARLLVRNSRRQDTEGGMADIQRNTRLSAIFMVLFTLTFLPATFDWIMSLDPHWYSTIFGVYNFSGLFLTGLATMTVLIILLRRMGPFRSVITEQHLHDLGKYIFAFSTFWAYIWFCQYMLIWYANIPEEAEYFVKRIQGPWMSLFLINLGLNWVIPFLVLMPRSAKRSEGVLLKVCVVIMVGHWLDLYLMILPSSAGAVPPFGVWEFAPIVGAIAFFFLWTFRALGQASVVPMKDPTLSDSLHHHI